MIHAEELLRASVHPSAPTMSAPTSAFACGCAKTPENTYTFVQNGIQKSRCRACQIRRNADWMSRLRAKKAVRK